MELTFRLPDPVIRLFFCMEELLTLHGNELVQLAIEEYTRNHYDPDVPSLIAGECGERTVGGIGDSSGRGAVST